MRVLHLLHSLRRGGLERVVVSVANGLSRRGVPQAIGCLHEAGPLVDGLDPGVELFVLGAQSNDPRLPWKLRHVCGRFQPDVVETVDFCSWPDATLATAFQDVQRVHVFHGFLDRPPWRYRLAGHVLARWTHRLLAVSHSLADQVASVFRIPRRTIQVVPNGVDADYFDPAGVVRPAPAPKDGPFTCVTVASLTPAKDPLILVEVAQKVGSGVRFVWVGDGPLRGEFERRIDAGRVCGSFTLVGAVDDVRPYLAAADAFVLPSASEAAPMAVLEAMAMQLPVIATRVGDVPRVVEPGRAGLIVDPGDADSLAATIVRLRSGRHDVRAMEARGRAEVIDNYSLTAMLDAYQRTYQELCLGEAPVRQACPATVGGGS